MPITDIAVTDIADFADGHEFGAAGAYVRIKGVARGTLDPAAPANRGIVDLDQGADERQGPRRIRDRFRHPAAEGCDARQRYPRLRRAQSRLEADLQPARRRGAAAIRRATTTRRPRRMPGSAFCSGAAIRWCGRAGTPARRAPMAISAPTSRPRSRTASRSPAASATSSISAPARPATAASAASAIPAASTDQPQARLTVRDRESDRRTEIARGDMGIHRRALDPPPAGGPQLRAGQDLRAVVRGDRARRCSASAMPACATSSRSSATRAPIAAASRTRSSRE